MYGYTFAVQNAASPTSSKEMIYQIPVATEALPGLLPTQLCLASGSLQNR